MPPIQKTEEFNREYFENIICYKAFKDTIYLNSIIDYIEPEYFDNVDIRKCMVKLVEFFERTNKIPTLPELRTCFTTNEEAQCMVTLINIRKECDNLVFDNNELVRKTELFLREKAVYYAVIKTTEFASKGDIDTNQILETFTEACNISLVDDIGMDYLEDIDSHIETICRPNNVISSGWKWLDEKLGGGFQAEGKALYALAGGTNSGKSIFLGNIAINILKQSKTVLIISLEMSEDMYARRISANLSDIPFRILGVRSAELKSSLYNFKSTCGGKLIIKEFPTKSITVNHINGYITKLKKTGIHPDIIIVDYINLIKGNKKYNGTYDEVKDVAERLRATTYQFKIPCVTATQLNRAGMKSDNPALDQTSESIGLPFTLDAQFAIWPNPDDKRYIHMCVQKNRFGENFGQTSFNIEYQTLKLNEVPQTDAVTNENVDSADNFLTNIQGLAENGK